LIALSCALADASRLELVRRNPCQFDAPWRVDHRELDYLRLADIDRYMSLFGPPAPSNPAAGPKRSGL
jgi:hypothetical protein